MNSVFLYLNDFVYIISTIFDISYEMTSVSLLVIFLLLIYIGYNSTISRKEKYHRRIRKNAKRELKNLSSINNKNEVIKRLRKTHPFEFEEIVLDAFASIGAKVRRNKSYTGDGGIDGQFTYKGSRYLVQSKRYSGGIKSAHIREFDQICKRRRCKGVFVHTGTTRNHHSVNASNVMIVSDELLFNLIHKQFSFRY